MIQNIFEIKIIVINKNNLIIVSNLITLDKIAFSKHLNTNKNSTYRHIYEDKYFSEYQDIKNKNL